MKKKLIHSAPAPAPRATAAPVAPGAPEAPVAAVAAAATGDTLREPGRNAFLPLVLVETGVVIALAAQLLAGMEAARSLKSTRTHQLIQVSQAEKANAELQSITLDLESMAGTDGYAKAILAKYGLGGS